MLCSLLCEKSLLPEDKEAAVLASALPSTWDTDEEGKSLFTCMLPVGDAEETKEEEEAEEEAEALLLSVLSAPEDEELEEGGGTSAPPGVLGLSWLLSLLKKLLSASSLGGPLKA